MKTVSRTAWAGDGPAVLSRQRVVAAPVRLREINRPHPAPPVVIGAVTNAAPAPAPAPENAFDIACITAECGQPHWTGEWRRLLATSRSPEKIYQTPEFFRFLNDSRSSTSDRFECFVITDRTRNKVVGMVPVRVSHLPLPVKAGSLTLATYHPRIVRLLGSVPLMPDHPALMQTLFAYLLRAFPDCAAVSMQALPQEMRAHVATTPQHRAFILHGWRDCHTIPLPDDWATYLGKINTKKRYNLGRQFRLLEQATGALQLQRIDRSPEVRALVDSFSALAPGADLDAVRARDYRVLAANRLLLSYVLRSQNEVIAVIAGTRYGDTWHVHQILYAPQYRHLSAGAVALHAALEDVITHFAFTIADLGYGTPGHRFASTNILKSRAHVLVTRKRSAARWLLAAFTSYDICHAACVRFLKPLAQRLSRA
jgi:hypothetical protein